MRETLRNQLTVLAVLVKRDTTEQVTYSSSLMAEKPEVERRHRLVAMGKNKERATFLEVDTEVDGFTLRVCMNRLGQPLRWKSSDDVHRGLHVPRSTALSSQACGIPVFLVIADPKRVAKATLTWRHCHVDDWPTTLCQKWVKQKDGRVTFELTRDRVVVDDAAAELALADRKSYLRPSKLFLVADPAIVKLAAELVAGEKGVV